MNKITILALAFAGLATASSVFAAGESTLSVGYAQSEAKYDGEKLNDEPRGINLKYRYELDTNWGVIGSLTYTGRETVWNYPGERLKLDLDYYSLMAGPAYRFNDYVSAYALVGVAYGNAKAEYQSSSIYASAEEDKTGVAGGVGVQFNVTPNFAIDASYEYTKLSEFKVNTWVLGFGYRF